MEEAGISYLLLTSAQSEHLQTAPEFLTYVAENSVPYNPLLPTSFTQKCWVQQEDSAIHLKVIFPR